MRQPRDQHWVDLLAALEREADTLGGYGEVGLRVVFHDGHPVRVRVAERLTDYKLGAASSVLREQRDL